MVVGATTKLVADNIVRVFIILGIEPGQSFTLGLNENTGAPAVFLPAGFKPRPYADKTLQDAVSVDVNFADGVSPPTTDVPIAVVKTGTTPQNFLITLTNTSVGVQGTGLLEVYVKFHS